MNTTQAKQQGAAAFKAGRPMAPAMNQAFLAAACKTDNLTALLKAYINGWTVAMLADGAPADMPSARELAAIEAA